MNASAGDKTWNGEPSLLETTERLFGAVWRDRAWARFGGRSIYIPAAKSLRSDHPLCDAIGFERAKMVADELGNVVVQLPLSPEGGWRRKREIVLADTLAGRPAHEIASKLGCTERRIGQLRAELRKTGDLPPLASKDR